MLARHGLPQMADGDADAEPLDVERHNPANAVQK